MDRPRYIIAPVEILLRGKQLVQLPSAMVSATGIIRALPDTNATRQVFLERRVLTVKVDSGGELRGRLIREMGREGAHFNLRLLEAEEETRLGINQLLANQGFSSPWKRIYPRIPVAPVAESCEVPIQVHFPRLTGKAMGEVVNFSYHGMLFEFHCSGLSLSERVDQDLRLRIVTSSGISLDNVDTQVVRIYDDARANGIIVRGLGVKFIEMKTEVRRKYDEMILEVCKGMKRES